MAEAIKKATREAFGEGLVALGAEMPDLVVLDADLAAATKTGMFKRRIPTVFFDCGIAEQNMISVAAGLAAAGKVPVASSFAMFAVSRARAGAQQRGVSPFERQDRGHPRGYFGGGGRRYPPVL